MLGPRFAAWSGLGFVLILVAVLVTPHSVLPERDAAEGAESYPTSAEAQAFFTENFAMQQTQTFLHAVGAVLFLLFAAALTGIIEPSAPLWARVALACAVGAAAVMVTAMGFVSALVEVHPVLDGRLLVALYDLGWSLHFKANYFIGGFLIAAGIGIVRSSVLPRFAGWSAVTVGIVTILAMAGNVTRASGFLQYPVFMILMVWVVFTAIMLLRGDPARIASAR